MAKALVIVESLAKAKTINQYLGSNYIVKSSFGHIRDLPISGSSGYKNSCRKKSKTCNKGEKNDKATLINNMGIDPWHDWLANYHILPGKEDIVCELKNLADTADHVYLATDLDREGEAIAWHLKEVIGGDNARFSRITFNEITKNAICQAFKNPGQLNINRVNAQQARRFMDRVVGYMISPLLWKKVARGLSAGRVQSVAMRLVVEREREIKAFIQKEYWKIKASLITSRNEEIMMHIVCKENKSFCPENQKQTQAAISILQKAYYEVVSCENKSINSKPSAPFITSTLQQSANTQLGFSIKKTMSIAQRLYEAGYITYMRTDSTNLSKEAIEKARDYIQKTFGEDYLPKVPNIYINKSNSQEAHEAIRPSNIDVIAAHLKDMEIDVQKLYDLIWCQFISCQMVPAKYDTTTLLVHAADFVLKTKGRKLRFDGWTKLMTSLHKNSEEITIPQVSVGDKLDLKELIFNQHFTNPPARFTEASLVNELEKRGIGRPSTYVSIISTIQDRGYVHVANRRFYAEKMGEIVTNRLEENFSELMDYDFTANMENSLDQIANNKTEWKGILDSFFNSFNYQLNKAEKKPEEGGMQPNPMVLTTILCPICNRNMGIRTASTGVFLGCSGYALSLKEGRCKKTLNLVPEHEILSILVEDKDYEINSLRARHRCQKCSIAMDSYLTDNNYRIHICGNNPSCDGYEIEHKKIHLKDQDGQIINCIKCNSKMCIKIGKFGKYMACSNEQCNETRKILHNGKIAPPKEEPIPIPELPCKKSDAYFVLRSGTSGIFLAANTFPQSRETRAPFVEELQCFLNRLPEKLKYLAEAPTFDPEGNKTLVRFSRKTKQQYVASEKAGKATGWSMFYINNKWQETKK